MVRLRLLKDQIKKIEVERLKRIQTMPEEKAHAMIRHKPTVRAALRARADTALVGVD